MCWLKRDIWKASIAMAGLVLLLVLMIWVPASAGAYEGASRQVLPGLVQPTPTVDVTATITALNEAKLQHENDWWWNYGATILSSLLSTLVLVGGALIGFWQWRMNRNDIRTKESKERQEAQDKDLRAQAEDRFQAAVSALGDEKVLVQVGGAILLRSFLHEEDKEIYGRYYTQIFDLAVAYLRPSNTSHISEYPDETHPSMEGSTTPLPLTPLRQALIVVFSEVFPLARKGALRFLDATGIQLDHAYLVGADLKQISMPYSYLRKAEFAFASLQKVYLRGSYSEGAQFVGAKLKQANLTVAHLKGANFNDADLEESNLGGAHLERAYFQKAHLKGAELGNADLSNADLNGADLSLANIEEARSLKPTFRSFTLREDRISHRAVLAAVK